MLAAIPAEFLRQQPVSTLFYIKPLPANLNQFQPTIMKAINITYPLKYLILFLFITEMPYADSIIKNGNAGI